MTTVYVVCEGQSEAEFVNALLKPHFAALNLYLKPTLIGRKGGNVRFAPLAKDIRNLLAGGHSPYCTTFFDFYGLPVDFPGKSEAKSKRSVADKARIVRTELVSQLQANIGENSMRRFIPYVQMHEFEGLLFSDPVGFASGINKPGLQQDFTTIRRSFPTPEHINDSSQTAPSKRIESLFAEYEKPTMGTLAALEIGLDKMRGECPLFDAWLKQLEGLAPLP